MHYRIVDSLIPTRSRWTSDHAFIGNWTLLQAFYPELAGTNLQKSKNYQKHPEQLDSVTLRNSIIHAFKM